jgi:hypothetical protein
MEATPTVVISTDLYQTTRPDLVIGEVTTVLASAKAPTDFALVGWAAAGLHKPSAFRVYLNTVSATAVVSIGHLSNRDWQEVQARLRLALAVT